MPNVSCSSFVICTVWGVPLHAQSKDCIQIRERTRWSKNKAFCDETRQYLLIAMGIIFILPRINLPEVIKILHLYLSLNSVLCSKFL